MTELPSEDPASQAVRDIGDVPAVEIITTVALHLMTAAAVKCGLSEPSGISQPDQSEAATQLDQAEVADPTDLAEARILINALAALVTGSAADLGTFHAGPLRDGLKSLQLAFREASAFPDDPGKGPGERFTGPVA